MVVFFIAINSEARKLTITEGKVAMLHLNISMDFREGCLVEHDALTNSPYTQHEVV